MLCVGQRSNLIGYRSQVERYENITMSMMSDGAANEKKADKLLGEWEREVVADEQAQVVHNLGNGKGRAGSGCA